MSAVAVNPTPQMDTVTVSGSHPATHSHFWAGDGFSFHDILDAVNPLQHLPIISMIYRAITHDNIGNVARVVGDGLYGGILGAASGMVNVALIETTGKDLGENLLSIVEGDGSKDGKSATPTDGGAAGTGAKPSGTSPGDPVPGDITPSAQSGAVAAAGGTHSARQLLPRGTLDPNTPVNVPFFPASSSPAMPSFGSAQTASMLAAAAPTTQLDVAAALRNSGSPQGVAGAAAAGAGAATPDMPAAASSSGDDKSDAAPATASGSAPTNGVKPLTASPSFIPIDTTPSGIMRMKAIGASRSNQAVPLEMPPGTQLTTAQQPSTQPPPVEFATKMREGLDKYNAMLAQRAKEARQSSVDTTS